MCLRVLSIHRAIFWENGKIVMSGTGREILADSMRKGLSRAEIASEDVDKDPARESRNQ